MTRTELIAKLEAAKGPSRELDAEIAVVAGMAPTSAFRPCASHDAGMFGVGPHHFWAAPYYTDSIDAALTLVPEGLRWRVSCVPVHQFASASVSDGSILSPNTKEWEGKHTTPAIALCIAALKAREKE